MSDLDAVLALTPRTTRLRDRESAKRAKRADITTPNQSEKATPSPFDRANPPFKKSARFVHVSVVCGRHAKRPC
jgi:hypothetical protein